MGHFKFISSLTRQSVNPGQSRLCCFLLSGANPFFLSARRPRGEGTHKNCKVSESSAQVWPARLARLPGPGLFAWCCSGGDECRGRIDGRADGEKEMNGVDAVNGNVPTRQAR